MVKSGRGRTPDTYIVASAALITAAIVRYVPSYASTLQVTLTPTEKLPDIGSFLSRQCKMPSLIDPCFMACNLYVARKFRVKNIHIILFTACVSFAVFDG